MSAEQELSASQILAKATEDVNKSVLVLQEAGQLLVDKAGEFAGHPQNMATTEVAGHIKLGTGFERLPDGTVNVVGGGGGSTTPPDLSAYYTRQETDAALTAHETAVDTALTQHKTELDTALASHEAEVSAALASHEDAVDTALTTHKTEVTAAEEAHKTEVTQYIDTALPQKVADGITDYFANAGAQPGTMDNATKWAGATRFVSTTAPATTVGVDGDIYMQLLS